MIRSFLSRLPLSSKKLLGLGAIFVFTLVTLLTVWRLQQPAPLEPPTKAKEEKELERPRVQYASDEILIKVKKASKFKIKDKPAPEDTGIEELNRKNKKYKVNKFEKVVKLTAKTKNKEAEIFNWYKITFPLEKKVLKEKKANDEDLSFNGEPREIDPNYGLVGQALIKGAIEEYRGLEDIQEAQPNYVVEAFVVPNDYHFSATDVYSYGDLWGLKKIQAEQAWNTTTGSESVIVAVVDSGVDYNHPDLKDNILKDNRNKVVGFDFYNNDSDPMDDHGHGTHCAGTVGAVGDNDSNHANDIGTRIVGVNWQVKIMPVKFLNTEGSGYADDGAESWIFAVDNGAKVISNSWGGRGGSPILEDSAQYVHESGVVNVAAAGNSFGDARDFFPASFPEVITVAATDKVDTLACYSNYGPKIDVGAPGGGCSGDLILSARASVNKICTKKNSIGQYYCLARGTSMACPHVAGLSALVLSNHPDFTPEEIRAILRSTADKVNDVDWDTLLGYGRVNAAKAVGASPEPPPIAKILSPRYYTLSSGKESIEIWGTATSRSGFQKYELQIARLTSSGTPPWGEINLNVARQSHTATKLPNGQVLIVGGHGDGEYYSSTELYDPGTNSLALSVDMSSPRHSHTATLLPNGKILIAGGVSNKFTEILSSAELYDPGTNAFVSTGEMTIPRERHTATLLNDGRVLITGGMALTSSGSRYVTAKAEIYNPSSGTFSAIPDMNQKRITHTATLLNNGKVLIVGGEQATTNEPAELFDPATNRFSQTGKMSIRRNHQAAVLLSDGKVLISGGYYRDYVQNKSIPQTSAELYNPLTGTFTLTSSMTDSRVNFPAVLLESGNVLVTGGYDAEGNYLASAEVYDMANNEFITVSSLDCGRAYHTTTLLDDGKVLIVGGRNKEGSIACVELFDEVVQPPPPEEWTTIASGTSPVNEGYLGTFPAGLEDGIWAIRLLVGCLGGSAEDRITIQIDLEIMAGWPNSGDVHGQQAIGDIDGDGIKEIVNATRYKIYARKPSGSLVFTKDIEGGSFEFIQPVILDDVDDDGKEEVIVNTGQRIFVLKGNGSNYPGWPVSLTFRNEGLITSSGPLAVGDVNQDGQPEIFVSAQLSDNNAIYVFGFDISGKPLAGWPQKRAGDWQSGGTMFDFSLVLFDLDKDGDLEIFHTYAYDGSLYAWHDDGKSVNGWPKTTPRARLYNLAVGYRYPANAPNDPIIAFWGIGTADKPTICPCEIYLLDGGGKDLAGWPKSGGMPILADFDGDGELEILYQDRRLGSYELDGSPGSFYTDKVNDGLGMGHSYGPTTTEATGDNKLEVALGIWDLYPGIFLYTPPGKLIWYRGYDYAPSFFMVVSKPALGDIDNDGKIEIIATDLNNRTWLWKPKNLSYRTGAPDWPMMYHDPQNSNNGNFGLLPGPILTPTPSPPPSFSLSSGWNEIVWLTGLPSLTAQTGLQRINSACGAGTGLVVARKEQDFWQDYVDDYGGVDFDLETNQTYFIKVKKDCVWAPVL